MKRTLLVFVLFFWGCVLFGQNLPKPRLISAQLPHYPPTARLTGTQGEVRVDFVLNASGEPESVAAVSGHPLLQRAAEDNVKSWRFEFPRDLYRTEWKYSTTFNFKITTDDDPYENAKLTVNIDSFEYVEVITNPASNKSADRCPSREEAAPPVSINDDDFVKLSRSGCYGTCPAYEVTVAANGDVSWKGTLYVHSIGTIHSHIDREAARALMEQFQ